jgi:hypothetical protein
MLAGTLDGPLAGTPAWFPDAPGQQLLARIRIVALEID